MKKILMNKEAAVMKRMIKYTIVALAGLFIVIACSKDKPIVENNQTEDSEGNTLPETIRVAIPDNLTRVSLTQDAGDADGDVKMAWEETDMIYVADHDNPETWVTYAIDTPLGDNPHVATFSRIGDGISASSFDILYGAPSIAMAEGIDLSVQTQEGNANTDHLQYMALISGVSTVENVQFTSDWASEKGGSFKQSGVVRLRLQMPAGVTTVLSVYLAASSAVFNTTNKLDEKTDMITVNFKSDEDITDDSNIVTVYANLPWENVSVPAGTDLTAVVKASDGYYYSKAIPNASGVSFTTGSVNAVKLSRTGFGIFAGGEGVDGNPYTISSKWHMMNMKPKMAENDGSTTYFKLLNDINMSGLSWSSLNPTSPYSQAIDFDGGEKTISYLNASFIYVIKGSVKDLKLDHATIGSGSQRGVLAQYIQGMGNIVSNVDISNSTVNGGTNTGALIGRINSGTSGSVTATIMDCDVTNTSVKKASCAGGLIGSVEAKVVVSNCSYSGNTVAGTTQKIGGLVGMVYDNIGCSFTNCRVEDATVDASSITDDARAGGLIGQLGDGSFVYGCTVGTSSKNVTVKTANPDDGKVLNSGGFVGVHYGTITKNGDVRSKAYVTIQSANTKGQPLDLGGFVGYHRGTIEYADAVVSMGDLKGQYIGGFSGYMIGQDNATACKADNCTLVGTIKGNNYTGAFVGYVKDNNGVAVTVSNNTVLPSTKVTGQSAVGGFVGYSGNGVFTDNTTHADVTATGSNAGGFVGWLQAATMTKCAATGNISETGSGSTFGGFAGISYSATLNKCFASGSIETDASTVGGFIGSISATGAYTVENCYSTCTMTVSNQIIGGLIGAVSGSSAIQISNCYSTADINSSFRLGGLIANINTTSCTVEHCAAWNSSIIASKRAYNTNWSSGAIVGTAHPNCVLTDNYRNPDMSLTVWWIPAADYNHPNVEGTTHPLVIRNDEEPYTYTEASVTSMGAPYQFPYHGKVEAGTNLSQLASTTLGWSSDVWDFTGNLPTLK